MYKLARGSSRIILIATFLVAVIAVAIAFRAWKRRHAPPETPPPVSTTTTQPAHAALAAKTRPAAQVPRDSDYLDVIHNAYPEFATTQPLGAPLELSQAAHLHLHVPIYLGGLGRMEMWITRPDAPPLDAVLKDAVDPNKDIDVHVLRQRPVFVHWMPIENGVWPPFLVCRTKTGYEVISAAYGHQPLPGHGDYHWQNAMSWNDKVIVPTTHGISVFRFGPQITESHHDLLGPGAKPQAGEVYSEPRFLLDADGLLAWLPWETGKVGGLGAVQYVEQPADDTTGKIPPPVWTDLTPANGWPPKLLHLVPLLDGTVLMLVVDDHGAVQVQFNTMEHV
ncbi:MAG TPA: hypothetical protein VFE47_29150, partial [Tepidisphaeraceae bacterium]|nr:hypothetical protein [Tepidisphaeraceae bacterium]